MRDIKLWAYRTEFKPICSDARLGGRKSKKVDYPEGTTAGQAGWDMSVQFDGLHDLAEKLSSGLSLPADICGSDCGPIQRGEILRLAILAHGVRGEIQINGVGKPAITYKNLQEFHDDLHKVGLYTRSGSTILLMDCLAGGGLEGSRLLQDLSKIWPGRTVVAFSTLGYRHGGGMYRSGEYCTEVGMRDTNSLYTLLPGQSAKELDPYWNDLTKMPWASENSPHAKVVKDGVITKYPVDEPPRPESAPLPKGVQGPPRKSSVPARR